MTAMHDRRAQMLELLEQHLSGGDGYIASPDDVEAMPLHLWEPALLAPVREFLSRPGKEFRARLVATSWALASQDEPPMPADLPLVVELVHAGALIVDDVQDGSDTRRGAPTLHRLYGVPLAINTGNWLYFWGLSILGQILAERIPGHEYGAILQHALRALLLCHQGQALDLATRVHALEPTEVASAVAMSTGLKTGVLMEFAAFLGARCAGANSERCAAISRFGHQLGTGLQMLDDLGGLQTGTRHDKAIEDMVLARLTWPWAWLAHLLTSGDEPDGYACVARWQARSRQVAESGDHDAASSLISDLAGVVGDHGRMQVDSHLSSALDGLRAALGPSSHITMLAAEIARLQCSYG